MKRLTLLLALTGVMSVGCMSLDAPEPAMSAKDDDFARPSPAVAADMPVEAEADGMFGGLMDEEFEEKAEERLRARPAGRPARPARMKSKGGGGGRRGVSGYGAAPGVATPTPEARIRQWFPEAFVWQPRVVTSEAGTATVDVRVPDQLTTWRVLGLAHSKAGQQAGAVHTFDSRMAVSVDPVSPGWLYVGDAVVLPSQVVSMGDPFTGEVRLQADGALSGQGTQSVQLSGGGSAVVRGQVLAETSGRGTILSELHDSARVDGAERVVQVRPLGKPTSSRVGGVLSGPRSFTLDAEDATEQDLSVQVFPGPLAVLHSELGRIAESPPGAYGYAILHDVKSLSATAGIEIDDKALRSIRIRSWQQLVKDGRTTSPVPASRVLLGLKAPEDELAQTLKDRLVRVVVDGQRGDGTWSASSRASLQSVIVDTAIAARSLPASESGARIRASGAMERHLPSIEDAYTAAFVLASGVVDGSTREQLEKIVVDGMEERPDGTWAPKALPEGLSVNRSVQLAVYALALADRTDLDWRGDLVSMLLQEWRADSGFRAGDLDSLCLDAVVGGLGGLDSPVSIILEVDGQEVSRGTVDPAQPKVPALLEASMGGEVTVRAEPPVPGLAFVATHTAWMPFTGDEALPGVEVEAELSALKSGREGQLTLTVSGPSRARVTISQGIPAGTSVDVKNRASLGSVDVRQDRVVLTTTPFGAGEVKTITLGVTPTFAGSMSTAPLEVSAAGQSAQLRPIRWTVTN